MHIFIITMFNEWQCLVGHTLFDTLELVKYWYVIQDDSSTNV